MLFMSITPVYLSIKTIDFPCYAGLPKKDGVEIIKWPHLLIMFPQSYQNDLEKQLKPAEYLTFKILVDLLLQPQTG